MFTHERKHAQMTVQMQIHASILRGSPLAPDCSIYYATLGVYTFVKPGVGVLDLSCRVLDSGFIGWRTEVGLDARILGSWPGTVPQDVRVPKTCSFSGLYVTCMKALLGSLSSPTP